MHRGRCIKKILTVLSCFLISGLVLTEPGFAAKKDKADKGSRTREKKVKWVKSKTGLNSLIQLSKDRKEMENEYALETRNYEKLKDAVEGEDLKKGMPAAAVERKFGEPVVTFPGEDGSTTKWVYKPGTGSFLDGIRKIYLIFDDKGSLLEWQSVDGAGVDPGAGK